MQWLWITLGVLVACALGLGVYAFRPLAHAPKPASFECLDLSRGSFVPLEEIGEAYGVGLSYAPHINETASEFDPDTPPPVFRKDRTARAADGDVVALPDGEAIFAMADRLEPGLGNRLRQEHDDVPPLLDYETELGIVLLDDVDPTELEREDFAPPIAFFIANDLSARSLAILGEGQTDRYDYWGASKSFPGFMPLGANAWVPDEPRANAIPCIEITTRVNGEIRQRDHTHNLIYTPAQMLRFVQARYPDRSLRKGDVVLTGTPGGVAAHVPRHLLRLANLVGLDRFKKLDAALGRDRSRYLSDGDVVVVEGEGLGSVAVTIRAAKEPLGRTSER